MPNPYRIKRTTHSPQADELDYSYEPAPPIETRELLFDPDTVRGVSPGRTIEQEELGDYEVADYAPEATEIISNLPQPWQDLANLRTQSLEEPTDYNIVSAAKDIQSDYLASTLHETGVPGTDETPPRPASETAAGLWSRSFERSPRAAPSPQPPPTPTPPPPAAPYITIRKSVV